MPVSTRRCTPWCKQGTCHHRPCPTSSALLSPRSHAPVATLPCRVLYWSCPLTRCHAGDADLVGRQLARAQLDEGDHACL